MIDGDESHAVCALLSQGAETQLYQHRSTTISPNPSERRVERFFGDGAHQQWLHYPPRATKVEILKIRRYPSPRRKGLDGGGERAYFKEKKSSFSSKDDWD
jgi:hypothetical protein